MIGRASADGHDADRATISAIRIDRFGERALEVAEPKAEGAMDGAAFTWTAIIADLSIRLALDARRS